MEPLQVNPAPSVPTKATAAQFFASDGSKTLSVLVTYHGNGQEAAYQNHKLPPASSGSKLMSVRSIRWKHLIRRFKSVILASTLTTLERETRPGELGIGHRAVRSSGTERKRSLLCRLAGQARQTRVERALGYCERLPSLSLFVPPHGVWMDFIVTEARRSFGAAAVWMAVC
ncbi:hypothetical protein TEQG_00492 [Trichophyton equinum CBS 127.97]|uniref:Uncharacterized protein n=1 Tax=Trichophyton equinum (strain ATCC MYA-4606 / CBS 127.97) TaxID=559882 RepID=F2PIQ4_TRIEC|nr:hypothetical protein TEQG_00492 [Trichophyton equinum CBS 127.97]